MITGKLIVDAIASASNNINNLRTEVDALNVLQASIGKTQLTEEQKKLCDVDGNGVVDNVDALYILQYAVGRIISFPVQR